MTNTEKKPVTVRLTLEQLTKGLSGRHLRRKTVTVCSNSPSAEELEAYEAAKAALELLKDSPYFEDGGPDYGADITKPVGTYETRWAETEEEWAARLENLTGK